MGSKAKTLADHLSAVPDPRKVRGQRAVLFDIILIAILGTLSSVDDWEGIEVGDVKESCDALHPVSSLRSWQRCRGT